MRGWSWWQRRLGIPIVPAFGKSNLNKRQDRYRCNCGDHSKPNHSEKMRPAARNAQRFNVADGQSLPVACRQSGPNGGTGPKADLI